MGVEVIDVIRTHGDGREGLDFAADDDGEKEKSRWRSRIEKR